MSKRGFGTLALANTLVTGLALFQELVVKQPGSPDEGAKGNFLTSNNLLIHLPKLGILVVNGQTQHVRTSIPRARMPAVACTAPPRQNVPIPLAAVTTRQFGRLPHPWTRRRKPIASSSPQFLSTGDTESKSLAILGVKLQDGQGARRYLYRNPGLFVTWYLSPTFYAKKRLRQEKNYPGHSHTLS